MMRHRAVYLLCFLVSTAWSLAQGQGSQRTIRLSWKNVVDRSLTDNLTLKSKSFDYDVQDLETWKSLAYFLPSLTYNGIAQKNVELPVFVFMGQRFVVGTPYTFQHSLSLTLPLLTGGSRWLNHSIQSDIRKSLSEELKGKEEEIVLNAMQAYYGIILSQELTRSTEEAVSVAKQNLDQVRQFYEAGTARELDFQRAQAQYSSTLPMLEAALSTRKLSAQRLKSLLNIPLTDSLVVVDSLERTDFLREYSGNSVEEFRALSKEHRNDMKALLYQRDAVESAEHIALGRFTPTVTLIGGVDHMAPMENTRVTRTDYIRSQSVTLSVSWPLFEGGKRVLDWEIAKIKTRQMDVMVRQASMGIDMDIEQNYYNFVETKQSLKSLKDALDQYAESLRISNLLYSQGMSNQLDVLNAQLLYTKSKTDYLQGIYRYNVSQLALLRAVGLLDIIWTQPSRIQ